MRVPKLSSSLIIFDCDGVLIDSEVLSARTLIEEAASLGVTLDMDYVRDHFLGRSFPTVAKAIRDGFNVTLPADFETRYRARLLERFEADLRPTAGILNLLARLTVPTCVATSSSPPRVARSLAIVGLDTQFARVFTASLVERGKPAPDLFLYAANAMGVRPSDCLVVEDSRPGIVAARAAGMEVCLFTGGSHMQGRGFDFDPPLQAVDSWAAFATLYPDLIQGPIDP